MALTLQLRQVESDVHSHLNRETEKPALDTLTLKAGVMLPQVELVRAASREASSAIDVAASQFTWVTALSDI